jgi:hypothetical protein
VADLSKVRTVLPIKVDATSGAVFAEPEGDPTYSVEAVSLPRDIFEELGRPSFITVTVEPGDLLNNEEE